MAVVEEEPSAIEPPEVKIFIMPKSIDEVVADAAEVAFCREGAKGAFTCEGNAFCGTNEDGIVEWEGGTAEGS